MAKVSIYRFTEDDYSTEGRAVGAIKSSRYRIPVLKALYELDDSVYHSNEELEAFLESRINLREADRRNMGSYPEWIYRLKWTLNRLRNSGLIEKNPEQQSSWKISEDGVNLLKEHELDKTDEVDVEEREVIGRVIMKRFDSKRRSQYMERRYWALGFGSGEWYERLGRFIREDYWQALDYDADDTSSAARRARELFLEIEVGDYALIKGYGGRGDLKVHYVGEVKSKDTDNLRINFVRRNVLLYNGKAPTGAGAGVWYNTILEVQRPNDIQKLFFQFEEIKPEGSEKEERTESNSDVIYKYSYFTLTTEWIDLCIQRNIIVLNPFRDPLKANSDGSEHAGPESTTQFQNAKIGEYFYACNQNNEVLFVGCIKSPLEDCEIPELSKLGWQQRRYEIVKGARKFDPYMGPEQLWAPAKRPHCYEIQPASYPEFNSHVMVPYFGCLVQDIFDQDKGEQPVIGTGDGDLHTLDRNVKPILDVDIIAGEVVKIMKLMQGNTGQMLGVFGSWGRGKTFFVRELCKKVNINYTTGLRTGESDYHFVKFHAWKYQDTEAIWAYLYQQISDAYFTQYEQDWWREVPKKWYLRLLKTLVLKSLQKGIEYRLLFRLNLARHGYRDLLLLFMPLIYWGFYHFYLKGILFTAENAIWLAGLLWTVIASVGLFGFISLLRNLNQLGKRGKKIMNKYTERPSFNKYLGVQSEIQDELKCLLRAWIKTSYRTKKDGTGGQELYLKDGEKRVLIFVDDIDRCQEEKIIQVVDALRVMLEDEEIALKIVILAAIDEKILQRAILWKYGKLILHERELADQDEAELEQKNVKNPNELVKEYMDKLFLGGVKLPALNENEQAAIIDNYAKESKLVAPEKVEPDELLQTIVKEFPDFKIDVADIDEAIKNLEDPTDEERLEAIRLTLQGQTQTKERMKTSEAISDVELSELKAAAEMFPNPTPRQLRIFLYRFILAKNLALAKQPNRPLTMQWSILMIREIARKTVHGQEYRMDPVFLQLLEEVDPKIHEFTPKLLDIVVPY